MQRPLLEVKGLKKYFPIKLGLLNRTRGYVRAVDDVDLTVYAGETLGLVGESGCGKSTTGRTILRLIEPTEGEVRFEGRNIVGLSQPDMRVLRREMQMIFQDPYASLNPRMTVEKIISEPLNAQELMAKSEQRERVQELLSLVGLHPENAKQYAHAFSGGQRQRIGIARALALRPKLIVADEPVSALDVSIQSQVLNLMQDLQEQFHLTYVFIAHDLSVVKHISDRIGVMYLGRIVELADKHALYENPLHPYTQALLSAVPVPDPKAVRERIVLQGDVPSPANPPTGCAFHPRCRAKMDICTKERPQLRLLDARHWVACHLYN